MQAGVYNITHKKGRFYTVQVFAKAYVSGSTTILESVDLTNYSATGSIRRSPDSSDTVANFTISGAMDANGMFFLQLPASTTENLTAQEYYYDVKLNDPSNRPQDFLEGKFILKPNITR
jgi:hypothetical protein